MRADRCDVTVTGTIRITIACSTVEEFVRQVANSEHVNSRRGQLERQRNAVEPATNLQNRRHIIIAKGEAICSRYRTLVKQLDSGVTQRIADGEIGRI